MFKRSTYQKEAGDDVDSPSNRSPRVNSTEVIQNGYMKGGLRITLTKRTNITSTVATVRSVL